METGDGVLAWEALRRIEEYEEAWERYGAGGPAHLLEPGPFRIRIQTDADLEAGRFELLAWENPRKPDRPASGFWREDERRIPGACPGHRAGRAGRGRAPRTDG